MKKKFTVDELLRIACIRAEQDTEALLDAHSNCPDDPLVATETEYLKQLKAYRMKRWGRTKLEVTMSEMKSVPVQEIFQQGISEFRAPNLGESL